MAILSSRGLNALKAALSRWLAASAGVVVVAVGVWSIGIVFVPGTLVILLSALLTQLSQGTGRARQVDDA